MESKSLIRLLWSNYKTKNNSENYLQKVQQQRLSELVDFARESSLYYGNLYKDLPKQINGLSDLPITTKKQLMLHFDDWVTDKSVKLEDVRRFVEDQSSIGKFFLGKYTVATTSGTTGVPGIFLLDQFNMKVTSSLALRSLLSWLSFSDLVGILKKGRRFAMVMAKAGHFASSIAAARMEKSLGRRFVGLSAHKPLPEIVEQLNSFQPALLAPYASMAALLATEQQNEALNISPTLIAISAEGLAQGEYQRIAKTFNAKVGNSYACTECPYLSYSCKNGWLHVNSDWVIVEAVDQSYQPVPAGVESHTVLITNLANRAQPIIRYDLGDSILLKPEPCSCGNKLPAIKVTGRSADVLSFTNEKGGKVAIAPLAFSILVDQVRGIERIQIIQMAPNTLRVRLRYEPGVNQDEVWKEIYQAISQLLIDRGLQHVVVERANELPEQAPSGKFREVIPLDLN